MLAQAAAQSVDETRGSIRWRMLLAVKGIGQEFAAARFGRMPLPDASPIASRSPPMRGLAATPWQSGRSIGSKASPRPAMRGCARAWCSSPGSGCAINRGRATWAAAGSMRKARRQGRRSSHWRASCWSPCGSMSTAGVVIEGAALKGAASAASRRLVRRATSPTVEQQQHHDQSAETRSVSADPGGRTDGLHGFKSRSEEWLRPSRAARRKRNPGTARSCEPTRM